MKYVLLLFLILFLFVNPLLSYDIQEELINKKETEISALLKEDKLNAIYHYELAYIKYLTSSFATAIDEAKKALSINPFFKEANLLLAKIYYKKDIFTQSLDYINRTLEIDDTILDAYLLKINIYFKSKQFDKAKKLLDNISSRYKINPYIKFKYGEIYYNTKFYTTARENFNYALDLTRNYFLEKMNKTPDNSIEKNLLEYNKTEMLQKIYLYLGDIDFTEKKYDEAYNNYIRSLTLNPNYIKSYIKIAELHIKNKHNQKAIDILKTGLKIDNDNIELLNLIGWLYSKKLELTLKDINMIKTFENVKNLYDNTIKYYKKLIKINPDNTFIYYKIALLNNKLFKILSNIKTFEDSDKFMQFKNKLINEILLYFQKSLETSPDDETIIYQFENTILNFERKKITNPSETRKTLADRHYKNALNQIEKGNRSFAYKEFLRAVQLNPQSFEINYSIAKFLFNEKLFYSAKKYFEKILFIRPEFNDAKDYIDLINYNTKRDILNNNNLVPDNINFNKTRIMIFPFNTVDIIKYQQLSDIIQELLYFFLKNNPYITILKYDASSEMNVLNYNFDNSLKIAQSNDIYYFIYGKIKTEGKFITINCKLANVFNEKIKYEVTKWNFGRNKFIETLADITDNINYNIPYLTKIIKILPNNNFIVNFGNKFDFIDAKDTFPLYRQTLTNINPLSENQIVTPLTYITFTENNEFVSKISPVDKNKGKEILLNDIIIIENKQQ